MEDAVVSEIKHQILQRSLDEVRNSPADHDGSDIEPCVICLERINEPAIAIPCRHHNFDFLCLLSWLEQQQSCPLCKGDVEAVDYKRTSEKGFQRYVVPTKEQRGEQNQARPGRGINFGQDVRRRPVEWAIRRPTPSPDAALSRRRHVYAHQLFSLHVGSNRMSAYRDFLPRSFVESETLTSRAKKWIRRELKVFSFLEDAANTGCEPKSTRQEATSRAGNAEFLLEYIVAILKTIDVQGSAGQAEEMIAEFVGRDNARLFLHELRAWLRSPYENLDAWDRHVQYREIVRGVDGGRRRIKRAGNVRDDGSQQRTKRRMLDRYVPD